MREEYPRPDFIREEWLCLNGQWNFYDGEKKRKIQVPFVCQSGLSGIDEKPSGNEVIYERSFKVPSHWKNKRIFIRFGAVDYECRVFVNGCFVGSHKGGHSPFGFDVTEALNWENESIRVEVSDCRSDESIPRGKQFWEENPQFIWYTPSTGIWQSVWLEPVDETSLESISFTPDIDNGTVRIDYQLLKKGKLPCYMALNIKNRGKQIFDGQWQCDEFSGKITVDIFKNKALNGSFHFSGAYWSPENPNLYDVTLTVRNEKEVLDKVVSYFGMRKIEIKEGRLYLNRKPYYQRLVLDQGYWKGSLITAPSDEAYKEDILKSKAMGFNGCRKHEKAEDPRFLYWADKLGFLVWEGMASFWVYTKDGAAAFMKEWLDIMQRDYSHPSIIVWEMLNESWGVPSLDSDQCQQNFVEALYHMAHSMDGTRPVISNDGWENGSTDICSFHSYMHGSKEDLKQQEKFRISLKSLEKMKDIVEKPLFIPGTQYEGQPVMLTEFGGISVSEEEKGWGYTNAGREEFLKELPRIMKAVYDSELLGGFCYTQLSDVEQETNGLLTSEHQYKYKPEDIKNFITGEAFLE